MSAAVAAAAAAAANANRRRSTTSKKTNYYTPNNYYYLSSSLRLQSYEIKKIEDWNKFVHYIKNYEPPLSVRQCSGSHVLGFLNHLGETKVDTSIIISCEYHGRAAYNSWNSLQGVVGRLRVAFEEYGGSPKTNPFASQLVCLYLKHVKLSQAKARGDQIHYLK